MLDNLRQTKGGVITWIFLGAIILVFVVSFGPGSMDKGCAPAAPTWAAKVDGATLQASEFEREYENLIRFYQQFGQAPTRELAAKLGIPEQALETIVNRELVAQEATRQGLVVTDAEISRAVHEMPAFQAGGRFDFDQYDRYARNVAGSAAKFEALLRKSLLSERMTDAVRQTVKVSDAEVRDAWAAERDRVALTYVRFPLAAAEAATRPSDAEVATYAGREAERLDAEVQQNPARFETKQRAHVRHLLVAVPANASATDDAGARQKAEAAAARIAKGEDFAKVTAEVSDDANTRAKGGDLGFISPELVDPAFGAAAFKLAAGQVSPPVRTATGWHLIQAIEVEAARTTPPAEARLVLAREQLAKEKGRALAQAQAEAALEAVKRGRPLAALYPKGAMKLGAAPLEVADTPTFNASEATVPVLGAAPGLREDAFATAAGQPLPKVYETSSGALVVAVVKSHERPDPSLFDAQRGEVARRLEERRQGEVLRAWTQQLAKRATIEKNPVYLRSIGALTGE